MLKLHVGKAMVYHPPILTYMVGMNKLSKYDKLWVVSSCFTNRQTTLPSTELLRGAGSTPRCAAAGAAKLPHR